MDESDIFKPGAVNPGGTASKRERGGRGGGEEEGKEAATACGAAEVRVAEGGGSKDWRSTVAGRGRGDSQEVAGEEAEGGGGDRLVGEDG